MENNGNSKNALLSLLLIIIILLGGFLVYDKLLKKENTAEPNKTECKCENTTQECNCPSCETSSKETNCRNDNIDYLNVFKNAKDGDGSYISYQRAYTSDSYSDIHTYAWLTLDGKVKYKVDGAKNNSGTIMLSNINNAVDIIFDEFEGNKRNNLYILLKNGDVYEYSVDNYESKIKTATKMTNLKNAIKFVNVTECPIKNAGCSMTFGVIDNNQKYIQIDSYST